jgi:putative Holliday junction resolvase
MSSPAFADAVSRLPPRTPIIGLDLGTKTIGIALSDITRRIASPVETLTRRKFTADAQHLIALAAREKAGLFLFGLPLNMDGSEGPRAQSTRAFARNLSKITDIPITFWDERLSTAAVERMLIDADQSRARRAEVIDKLAATYILQSALDSLIPSP